MHSALDLGYGRRIYVSFLYAIIASQVHLRSYVHTRVNFVGYCDARDVVRVLLVHAGIECAAFYSSPIYLNSAFRSVSY